MRTKKLLFLFVVGSLALLVPGLTPAVDSIAYSQVGVGGYDLVSYHTGEKPQRGNGNHLAVHDGVAFLFVSDENKREFESRPEQYLPAYGGYCAFGVSVGKKFYGDPDVWKIVDGRLYLNLDNSVKKIWVQDIPGRIKDANRKWSRIKNKAPSDL